MAAVGKTEQAPFASLGKETDLHWESCFPAEFTLSIKSNHWSASPSRPIKPCLFGHYGANTGNNPDRLQMRRLYFVQIAGIGNHQRVPCKEAFNSGRAVRAGGSRVGAQICRSGSKIKFGQVQGSFLFMHERWESAKSATDS